MTTVKKAMLGAGVAGTILIATAIMIPNLLRSRMSDIGNPGARMVSVINTSQIMYSTTYERVGYAPNLAALGPAGGACNAMHACLLDSSVACPQGKGLEWCTYGSYRFNVQSSSTEPPYKDYWVTATRPINHALDAQGMQGFPAIR